MHLATVTKKSCVRYVYVPKNYLQLTGTGAYRLGTVGYLVDDGLGNLVALL
jgi:hypothetical protein